MPQETVREILDKLCSYYWTKGLGCFDMSNDKSIDQAISSLAKAIRERKKKYSLMFLSAREDNAYNQAISDIADWIEK